MPSPQSFKVPLIGWKLYQESPTQTLWINEAIPDVMGLRFSNNPPNDLPDDYPDIDSHRNMFETIITQSQGAVVTVEFLNVKGVEAFQTIFKFRMPSNGLGKRYLGTLMFPFERFFCGFSFQCDEYGTTGTRESMVYLLENAVKPVETDPNAPAPVHFNSIDEFFDRIKQTPLTRNPSDDEKYDQATPTHPLSRTRQYLKRLADTIEFDDEVRNSKPYRGVLKRSASVRFWNIFKR